MRRITRLAWTVSLGAVLLAFGAKAQSNPGFTAATPVAPFTATTGGVTATMPAGPAIVVTNTGATNAVYCQQGPTASTSSQYIASGSWFEFARINGQTQMTCITATGTTTVNMVGGVGQASGSGGGGGGGGGPSANVSIVSPLGSSLSAASVAVVIASDQAAVPISAAALPLPTGAATSALQTTGNTSLATIATNTGAATPAGGNIIGKVGIDQTTPGTTNGTAIVGVNAATALAGAGAVGTGSLRIAVGQDTTTVAGSASIPAGTNLMGKVGIDQTTPGTTNGVQVNAALPAGTNLLGKTGIDQTTDGTTNGVRLTTQYPSGTVAETASATGTTGATTATLATNTGQTTSICGFSIRANATAAATNNATVTGTITGTLNFTQWTAPLASGLGVTEMIFTPCIPASTTNTSIAVISGAPGSGGVVSVSAWGFLK